MGKWIRSGEHHFCSECEEWALYEEFEEEECLSNYCPNCGCKMDNSNREPPKEDAIG